MREMVKPDGERVGFRVNLYAGKSVEAPRPQDLRIKSARRTGPRVDPAGRSWSGLGYPACATADSLRKSHQKWFRFRTPPAGLSHSVLAYSGRSFPDTIWQITTRRAWSAATENWSSAWTSDGRCR